MRSKSYFGDKVNKVRLYKKGKFWVAASMTVVTLGLGALSTVNADQIVNVASSSSVVAKNKNIGSKNSLSSEVSSKLSSAISTSETSSKTSSVTSTSKASSKTSSAISTSETSSKTSSVTSTSETSSKASSAISTSKTSSKASSAISTSEASSKTSSVTSLSKSSSTTDKSMSSTKVNNSSLSESDKESLNTILFNSETATPSDQMMQKMSRNSFAAYDPHYGTWTIYFQDTQGAMLYYPVGWTNSTSSQITSDVTPYVKQIEDEGYAYDYAQIFYSNIGSYSYNYVTLVFKEAPLVKGGTVTVNYVDSSTGKVLKTGTATYEDRSGNTTSTPYVGCAYKTNSITIQGYTLSKTPSNANGKITSSAQTVEYDYTPNQEKAQIQIVDGSENNKVLDTVTVNGTYGSTSSYDINSYVSSKYSNYNVQSNNWPGSITWDSSNDGTVPIYQVILTHKTQSGTDTRTITQTINYQYSDGKQAEPTKTTSIVFTRPSTTDEVTGITTYGSWTNETGTTEFPSVQSPQITGYTPSYSQSSAVTGVTPDSSNNTQTIIYVPNKEEMTIVYYDMDEKKVLQEKVLQGDYGTSPNYDYQSVIQNYVNEGYNIARNQIPSSGLVFSNASGQQYEVDFTHTTEKLPANAEGLTGVVTHTIHYVDTTGKTLSPDVVQTITYTRGATEDKVTGVITYTDWTTTTNPAEFPSVTSPTIPGYTPSKENSGVVPVNIDFPENVHVNFPSYNETIVYTPNATSQTPTGATSTVTETINYINDSGVVLTAPTTETITFKRNSDGTYTAEGSDDFPAVSVPEISGYTPNVSSIPEVDNVKATDANIVKTVVYSPEQSQIVITYYDVTSKKMIKSDTLIGNYNESPNYDVNTVLDGLEKNGYKEVNSNVPSSLIFTSSIQSYTINLEHTYSTSTQNATVTQTINYKYADGATAADSVNKQLTFTRTATTDNVLGTTQYSTWSPTSGEFPAVTSPVITGYTPTEQTSQAIENVNGSTPNNVQNIVYNANQETIDVNYIDQTTGKTINTVVLQGPYNTTSNYTTASDLQKLENEGYVLVQDNYPTGGAKFDKDGVVQSYNVLVKENITTSTQSQTVTQTIHYVDSNNNAIDQDKDTSITFTRNVNTNQVTKAVTYGAWSPASGQFPSIQSPTITGYTVTPGEEQSQAVSVSPSSANNVQTITYTANQEKAVVQFIDETDNAVLSTVDLSGAYNTHDSYSPASTIQKYTSEGYKLDSDGFPQNGIVYNYDGTTPVYKITFGHNTRIDTVDSNPDNVPSDELTHTVQQTINYVYSNGTKAADSVTNSVTFNRSVTVDQVTHQVVSEGSWTPTNGSYPSVPSPTITGYTPDVTATTANDNVVPTDSNSTVTVTYTANKEHAVVNYVDDNTGKTVASQTVNGTFGGTTTYDPTTEENTLKGEGYTVGNSDLPANDQITFSQDGQVPTYTVHLNEGTTTYTPNNNPANLELTHNVNQTIHYQYSNGTQAHADATNTISFTRNATKNNVTGAITYTDWTPTDQTFPAVQSPSITGYTPNKAQSDVVSDVNEDTPDNTQTITYTANPEHAIVNYVDDATGKTVASQTVNGTFGGTTTYDPTTEENTLEGQGYQIGSNNLPTGDKITFSQDGQVPTYTVHLTEGTTTYTPTNNPNKLDLSHTVNQTIHYQYSNGTQAHADATNSISFTRNATKNNVTGAITYTPWTPTDQTFPAVQSPSITGYTPNKAQSDVVSDVNEDTPDNTQTITYTANPEHAIVNYVDDATGKTVASQTVNGTFGGTTTYDPTTEENTLKSKGYTIGTNNLPTGDKITFSQDGQVPTYTVHLNEGTTTYTPNNNPEKLELTHNVNQTIHYQYSNGTQAYSDDKNTIQFTRNATKNNVTGAITYTPWTPTDQTFPAVQSPSITGYTPNKTQSDAVSDVNEDTPDNTQTITYTANAEHAVVNYVDDNTGKTVASQTVNGTFGGTTTYDPTTEEDTLKNQGYQIGSNNLPSGDKITFSQDGQVPTYTVHLTEGTTTYTPTNNPNKLDLSHTVNQTIHYVYSNGSQAAPDATKAVTFTRNATKNNVTGAITYTDWTPTNQTFEPVTSPTITGYTPNATASTPVEGVNENSQDNTQTITYTANPEHAIVNYVDDNTGKTVASQTVNGTFNSSTTYDPTTEENTLKNEGYTIGNSNLPAGNKITFTQDGQVPTYTVHLNEGTTTFTPSNNPDKLDLSHTVSQTIHYVYSNGSQAAPDATKTVTFTRTATKDNVTNAITYSNWTPANSSFPAVTSPTITGYTPSASTSTPVNLTESSQNNTQTITYTANPEHAVVNYVDDNTGKIVASQTVDGTFDNSTTYDPTNEENTLKNEGYTIGSNNLPAGDKITFSQDGQVLTYTVHLNEGTTSYTPSNNPDNLDLSHTVNQTIHYVYSNGTQAAPDVTKSITFTRNATKNNVTNTITYTNWTPSDQQFPAVTSPTITGYTPSKPASDVVSGVNEDSKDNTQTITYTANPEHAIVNYVDDATGKTVASQTVDGTFDNSTTYDPMNEENTLKNEGYTIGSNNLPAGDKITFSQDGQVPTYTVHLNEGTTSYTPNDNPDKLDLTHTVNQTIHYVYSDGSQAAPDATKSITFTRNATKNNVTGAITYTNWTPSDQQFPAVTSPTITGYTPSKSTSDVVSDVNEDSKDNTQTITYTANPEHAVVNYVDDTTGKTVASQTVDGTFNNSTTYNPTNEENTLKNEGYTIGNSNLPAGNKITFTQDGQVPTYTVHLNEGTTTYTPSNNPENLDLSHTVNQTIHYVYSDGSQAAPDATKSITFTRNATKNNVTGAITYTNWTPSDQQFPAVTSPTITGYTPSASSSTPVNDVNENSKDDTQTITYLTNAEKAVINYVDDATGKTVASQTVGGQYGKSVVYDPTSEENTLKGEGYTIGNSDLPTDDKITFNQDGRELTYTVHLNEGTTTYTPSDNPDNFDLTHTVNQTIQYFFNNGDQAAPSVKRNVTFTRTAVKNNVTGKMTYTAWTPSNQSFNPVTSPTITGYTPSKTASTSVSVNEGSQDNTQTIIYSPSAEHAVVNYVDDTTGKTVASQTVDGTFGNSTTYDPTSEENTLKNDGYTIGNSNLPSDDKITFTQDGQVPTYTVHLNEGTTSYTPSNNPDNLDLSHTVNQTIHYVYSDGTQAAPDVKKSITFTRNATENKVTGAITYTNWTPSDQQFPAVTSPTIAGYVPDKTESDPVNDVNADTEDNTQTIIYDANQTHAVVNYVDDNTGKTVTSQIVDGTVGGSVTYNPTNEENTLKNEGYIIDNSDLPSNDQITFGKDNNIPTYTVHLTEGTTSYTPNNNPENLDLSHTVNQTIHYVYSDGSQAAPDATKSITFTRNATKNNVTGAITYTNWTPSDQQFPAVTSPTITGYTPSASASTAVDVNEGSSDNTQTITYTANKEHAVVNYVDDATGKVVASQTVDGTFGGTTTYDPTSEENTLKNEGYTIGSSDLPSNGEIKFTQDGQVPTYTVHLNEGTTTYTPSNNPDNLDLTKKVTRTINYVDANGKQLAPSVTQTITFTRNAMVNEVTGQVTYGNWQSSGNDDYNAVESPAVKGYTPTQKTVEAENNVSVNSTDQVVNVVYRADKPATSEHKPSEPAKKPATPEHKPSEPVKKPATPEHKLSEPVKKPQASVEKPTEHVQSSKKPVQTAKPVASQSSKVETVKKAVPTKQASSANEGTVRVAEQSTTIEKQTPNNSAAQSNENKNTLPQTGEDSTNHSLFGELLLALSGLIGLFGIGKRKKDKEE